MEWMKAMQMMREGNCNLQAETDEISVVEKKKSEWESIFFFPQNQMHLYLSLLFFPVALSA